MRRARRQPRARGYGREFAPHIALAHHAAAADLRRRRRRARLPHSQDRASRPCRLPGERRDLYQRFIDAAPRLLPRIYARRNLTVVHGDAHVWNNFLPRDGGDDVRFFDWDAWRIGVASGDLAYMMATHWYPERRR